MITAALEPAGMIHLWATPQRLWLTKDTKPDYARLPWLYGLHKIINNLAEKRGWGTRYRRDGTVEVVSYPEEGDPEPGQYIWAKDVYTMVYRSCTGNTIAIFRQTACGWWETEVWHRAGGPVCTHVEMYQDEAEAFSWKF